jgi:hypothetical protein
MDVHRSTVCAWELKFRAALLASARAWHLHAYLEIEALETARPGLRLIQHNVRSDATKAQIWMEETLNAVYVESSKVTVAITGFSTMQRVRESTERTELLAELQVLAKK